MKQIVNVAFKTVIDIYEAFIFSAFNAIINRRKGHVVAWLVEALSYKLEGHDEVIGIFQLT
jgi:hypothetical protein